MRAQEPALGSPPEIKGVVAVAGRVFRRHVEELEVVQVVLDLGACYPLVAEEGEDVLYLAHQLRQRVLVAPAKGSARVAEVHPLPIDLGGVATAAEFGLACLQGVLNFSLGEVERLA